MSKISEKLADKIEKDCGIKCDPNTFERTYAGKWMKSSGAFVWTMNDIVGSTESATELIKSKYKLVCCKNHGDIEIFGIMKEKTFDECSECPWSYELTEEQKREYDGSCGCRSIEECGVCRLAIDSQ